jgi:DNA repair protein RadC
MMAHRIPIYKVQLVREGSCGTDYKATRSPGEAAANFRAFLDPDVLDREVFAVAMLDGKNRMVGLHVVSQGTLNACLVHPREIFKAAILANAAAVILCHTHPSGDPAPSAEDLNLNARLVDAGRLLGVEVLDHVILGAGGCYDSLRERGQMNGSGRQER